MTPLQNAAREVVMRARAGDQVAIAHIVKVHEGAKAGDVRLQQTEEAIKAFVKANPVRKCDARWGAEVSVNTNPVAQQSAWKARASTPQVFAVIIAKTAPFLRTWDIVVAMLHGPLLKNDNPLMQVAGLKGSRVGGCVRKARQLQMIATNSNVPISTYCSATGWELGE